MKKGRPWYYEDMKRIGVYSGTFDPVHAGHIAFATAARTACGLDKIVFLPEARPRGKQHVTDISHRIALLERATSDVPYLQVTQLSSLRFTVQATLPELRALFKDAAFTLLVGSDVALKLQHWPGADALLRDMSLAIGLRAGGNENYIKEILPSATIIKTGQWHMASSQVRSGNSHFFNPAVAAYISENALYAN